MHPDHNERAPVIGCVEAVSRFPAALPTSAGARAACGGTLRGDAPERRIAFAIGDTTAADYRDGASARNCEVSVCVQSSQRATCAPRTARSTGGRQLAGTYLKLAGAPNAPLGKLRARSASANSAQPDCWSTTSG